MRRPSPPQGAIVSRPSLTEGIADYDNAPRAEYKLGAYLQ